MIGGHTSGKNSMELNQGCIQENCQKTKTFFSKIIVWGYSRLKCLGKNHGLEVELFKSQFSFSIFIILAGN